MAAAHLEAFESIEGIAREKASIFDGLEPGGTAILNGDIDTAPILAAGARGRGARIVTFGEPGRSHRLLRHRAARDGHRGEAEPGARRFFKLGAGRHFAMNALAVLAAVREALGADRARRTDLAAGSRPRGAARA